MNEEADAPIISHKANFTSSTLTVTPAEDEQLLSEARRSQGFATASSTLNSAPDGLWQHLVRVTREYTLGSFRLKDLRGSVQYTQVSPFALGASYSHILLQFSFVLCHFLILYHTMQGAHMVAVAGVTAVVSDRESFSQRFFEYHSAPISAISVSPDGTLVASGDRQKLPIVFIWDARSCAPVKMLTGVHRSVVTPYHLFDPASVFSHFVFNLVVLIYLGRV